MFLSAVILILQEIMEAALLVSVLLVLEGLYQKHWGSELALKKSWLLAALVMGVIGAWLYALATPAISEWFDYVGQEVVNSSIHMLSFFFLLVLVGVVPSSFLASRLILRQRIFLLSMLSIVLLALLREGSEIILYLGGVTTQSENVIPVLAGSAIGAGIGISSGVFLYYSLVSMNRLWSLRISLLLLAFIGGNMVSQVVMLLSQADWLPYTSVAWNTSALVAEDSITGHLLYALMGYEATPSILQVGCYFAAMLLILLGPLRTWAMPDSRFEKQGVVGSNV